MKCRNCGQTINDNAAFCNTCGAVQNPNQQPNMQPKVKKRSGCLTSFLVFVGIIAVIAMAAYFLMPGLLRPYDLDVKASTKAYESAIGKLKLIKDEAPAKGTADDYKITYGAPQEVEISLSSEELTSFLTVNRPEYYALENVQIRINVDDTIEAAATVDTSYIFNEVLGGKYSKEDANKAFPMLGLLPAKVNVYCKFSGGIENNKLEDFSMDKISVMGISIPADLAGSQETNKFIKDSFDSYLAKITEKSGASCDLLQVADGKLDFAGQVPSTISRVPAD